MRPVYNDIVYNDKRLYNDISFGPSKNPINLMNVEPVCNSKWVKMKPTYNDNFALFKRSLSIFQSL